VSERLTQAIAYLGLDMVVINPPKAASSKAKARGSLAWEDNTAAILGHSLAPNHLASSGEIHVVSVRRVHGNTSLKYKAVHRLAEKLHVSDKRVLEISSISEWSFQRWSKDETPLEGDVADRVLRVARISAEAERVLGNEDRASAWLSASHPVLGDTPLSLLSTDAGAREVEDELTRIEWGDFA